MPIGEIFPADVSHVTASSSSVNRYQHVTKWLDATGVDKATWAWRNAGSNYLYTRPAYQTAAVRTDKPDAWGIVGTDAVSNDGETVKGPVDVTGYTATKRWIRFGFGYTANTGSFAQGDVWMQVSCDLWGSTVSSSRFQVSTDSTDKQDMAVTAWMPAIFADKVKMTIGTSQETGLKLLPCFQTATTLTSTANAWKTATTDWTPNTAEITSNQESCTGEIAPNSISGDMWIRFGVAYWLDTGTRGQADVAVSISVRTT